MYNLLALNRIKGKKQIEGSRIYLEKKHVFQGGNYHVEKQWLGLSSTAREPYVIYKKWNDLYDTQT